MEKIKSNQKITPFLWFDSNAEEAVKFYTGIFKNSEILNSARYTKGAAMPEGTIMTMEFTLEGQRFVALNGGPNFKFNHAVSFVINCESQEEIDYFWNKLTEGGSEEQCGWLLDKYGLSWQVIPSNIARYFKADDSKKAERVMQAVLKMKKIIIADMEKAIK